MPTPPSSIRLARASDAERIAAIYAPHVLERPTSFERVPPDASAMAERIAAVLKQWPWLVWDEGQGAIAYAYASAHAERIAASAAQIPDPAWRASSYHWSENRPSRLPWASLSGGM